LPRCTMQLENSERIAGIHEWNHQRGAVAALAGRLPLGGAPGDEQRLEMRDDGLGEGARVGGARADALLDVAGNGRDLDLFPLLVDPFDPRAVPADGIERALRDPVDDLVDRGRAGHGLRRTAERRLLAGAALEARCGGPEPGAQP